MLGGEKASFGNENRPSFRNYPHWYQPGIDKTACNRIHLQQMDNFVVGKKSREGAIPAKWRKSWLLRHPIKESLSSPSLLPPRTRQARPARHPISRKIDGRFSSTFSIRGCAALHLYIPINCERWQFPPLHANTTCYTKGTVRLRPGCSKVWWPFASIYHEKQAKSNQHQT